MCWVGVLDSSTCSFLKTTLGDLLGQNIFNAQYVNAFKASLRYRACWEATSFISQQIFILLSIAPLGGYRSTAFAEADLYRSESRRGPFLMPEGWGMSPRLARDAEFAEPTSDL